MRSRLSIESVERSNAPPASFTGTPSTRILAYLLSPPRMKSEVVPPYEPLCTRDRPGTGTQCIRRGGDALGAQTLAATPP